MKVFATHTERIPMNPEIWSFLSEMATTILSIVGISYVPLVVLILFRAGRIRGLNADNMSEKLGDLCFDTLKESISNKIQELLQINNIQLPPGLTIQTLSDHLHHDSESLELLLRILKNLSELGLQSTEFQQIIHFFSQF